jgi:glutamine synthetase
LPTSLAEAIDELDGSAYFREAIGGELVDFLLTHKRSELARWQAVEAEQAPAADGAEPPISDWEQREYFDLY